MLLNERPSLEGRADCPFYPCLNLSDWTIRVASSSCLLERETKEPKKISQIEQKKNFWYRSKSWKIRGKPQNKELVLPAVIWPRTGAWEGRAGAREYAYACSLFRAQAQVWPFGWAEGQRRIPEKNKRKRGSHVSRPARPEPSLGPIKSQDWTFFSLHAQA